MIKDEPNDDVQVRRFLLGEMTADERAAFEEDFIVDEGLYDRVRACEDEMIEAYIGGLLLPAEIEKFERNFLKTKRGRERVAFTRAMLARIVKTSGASAVKKTDVEIGRHSVPGWLARLFKFPAFAIAGASAVIILVVGGWLVLRGPGSREIAKEVTPTPRPSVQTSLTPMPDPTDDEIVPSSNQGTGKAVNETPAANTNANRETPNANAHVPAVSSPVLALFSGSVRSGGTMSEITLPENAPGLNLQLKLEDMIYKTYQVDIVDPNGSVVFHGGSVGARHSALSVFVPASSLGRNDYIAKVSGINPNNKTESVADYSFRVKRR